MKKIGAGLLLLISLVVLYLDYTFDFGLVDFFSDYLVVFVVVGLFLGGLLTCRR